MFYLLHQSNPRQHTNIREELLCFEADSLEHAKERARWFGIDLEERRSPSRYKVWTWHEVSCHQPVPRVNRNPLNNDYYTNWIIVYLNGNIKCSRDPELFAEIR